MSYYIAGLIWVSLPHVDAPPLPRTQVVLPPVRAAGRLAVDWGIHFWQHFEAFPLGLNRDCSSCFFHQSISFSISGRRRRWIFDHSSAIALGTLFGRKRPRLPVVVWIRYWHCSNSVLFPTEGHILKGVSEQKSLLRGCVPRRGCQLRIGTFCALFVYLTSGAMKEREAFVTDGVVVYGSVYSHQVLEILEITVNTFTRKISTNIYLHCFICVDVRLLVSANAAWVVETQFGQQKCGRCKNYQGYL